MADDETKQETPKTTDEDEDKDDVTGHRSRPFQQRPDGDADKEQGKPDAPGHITRT